MPASLAALLCLALIVQFLAAGAEPELPPAMSVSAPRSNFQVPVFARAVIPRAISDRPLFAPRTSPGAATNGGPPPVLDGAIVAGMVTVRGRSYAVVRKATGAVVNLSVGGTVGGWRLVAIRSQGAVFVKGRERRDIAYGAQAVSSEPAEAPGE